MSIPQGDIIIAIRIEALGTAQGQLYFCDRQPPFDIVLPGNKPLWRAVLKPAGFDSAGRHATGGIPSFSSSADFKTGASTAAAINFELVLFDDNSGNHEDIYRLFHNNLRPIAIDTLSVAISATDTTIIFASGSPGLGTNDIIWIGREAIQLGPEGVPGTFNGCTRGVYETVATEHDASKGQDVTIFDKWVTPEGRKVTLGYLPPDKAFDATATAADFQPLWSGTINDMGSVDAGNTLMIETTGLGVLTANTQLYPRRWRGRVTSEGSANSGSISTSDLVLEKNPRVVEILPRGASDPSFPFAMGTAPVRGAQAWVRFKDTAVVLELIDEDPVTYELQINNKLKYVPQPDFGTAKTLDVCWEIVSTNPKWPGQSFFPQFSFGASKSPKFGDVFTALLNILTSVKRGPAQNGSYDTGIPFGIGIPHTQLAISEIEALRGDYVGRSTYKSLYVGTDPEPDNALQWIQEHLLSPFGLVMALNADALWTVKALKDLPDNIPPALTESDLFGGVAISYDQALTRAVDKVEFAYQGSATGETKQLDFVNETVRERRLNEAGVLNYAAIGMDDDGQAQAVGQTAVHRWRDTVPEFEFSTPLQLNGSDSLGVGDPFTLTSGQLPNVDIKTGIPFRGVVDMLCYTTGRTTHMEGPASRYDYRAMQWGLGQGNLGRIGFALEVVAAFVYVDGTGVIEFTPTLYQSPIDDGYVFDKDVEPVQANWVLKHMSEFLEGIDTGLVVGSVDIPNNKITFSTYPAAWDSPTNTPPVGGDLMHSANWGILTEASQKVYAHQANASGELSGGDPGFLWIRG